MSLSRIKSLEFWAREYRMPLFWLTDPRHLSIGNNNLFLYKNSVLHCYYLNQRIEQERLSGKRYFSNAERFRRYLKATSKLKDEMQAYVLDFKKINLDQLSDRKLRGKFHELAGLIGRFSALYTKTEAQKMKCFEGSKDKQTKKYLEKVGKRRFELRRVIETIFRLFLGDVLRRIVKRFGVKTKDFFFYDHHEIERLFHGKLLAPSIIQERQRGYALIDIDGRSELLVGGDNRRAWELVKSMTQSKGRELQGQVAYPGITRGRVELILHNVRDLTKRVTSFRKGNVLVTEMTTPATLMACRKAAAIVTDEGGVLCHAAIISRELKKPCVVGTKIATQRLKNGDEVEVDAEKGVVRVLKRAQ